jgi:hypothetical protein
MLVRLYLKNKPGVVTHSIIPATQMAEVERLWSNASLDKSMISYLKIKTKNLEIWLT